ncbi:MAG: nicotinate-nucleotide adenylyltransferase [Candidatus Pacebacteria bacterium]|nr:nicotinate-nucleotide adenylyltransferase [Candidatus Paceibacterota bacterium]
MIDTPTDSEALGPKARKPRLGVFGGSFDPIHNGHLFIAGEIIRRGLVDEILFVPANVPPHKPASYVSPAELRLTMLQEVLEPYEEFSLSDIEVQHGEEPSYTIDTIHTLAGAFPEHTLCFLMGMDSLVELHQWRRAPELIAKFELLIYPRPGVREPAFAELSGHFGPRQARRLLNSILDTPPVPISATQVRAAVRARQNLAGLVPDCARTFIEQHNLYKETEETAGLQ